MAENLRSRREMLKVGMTSVGTGLAVMSWPGFVFPGQEAGEELVPFQNVPRAAPNSLDWETLDEWLTPQDQVVSVQHYGSPKVDLDGFQLEVMGLVERA